MSNVSVIAIHTDNIISLGEFEDDWARCVCDEYDHEHKADPTFERTIMD